MGGGEDAGAWFVFIFLGGRRRAEVENEVVRSLRRRRGEDAGEEGRKEGRGGGQTHDLISTLSLQEVEQHAGTPTSSHTAPHATS